MSIIQIDCDELLELGIEDILRLVTVVEDDGSMSFRVTATEDSTTAITCNDTFGIIDILRGVLVYDDVEEFYALSVLDVS